MDNAGYTTLTRQSGLLREMTQVANNIANLSTTGFRREGTLFAEYVQDVGQGEPSLSMASAEVRNTSFLQGALEQTGAPLDLAIEGPGFFLIETPEGEGLTRAGSFTRNEVGDVVTPDGFRLLDAGGAPVFVPADAASIAVGADGTLTADGQPLAQIGLWRASDPLTLQRESGVMFSTNAGIEPVEEARIMQGFLEGSNVDPVGEIARMIDVQRSYELGQSLLDKEDERIRSVLRTVASQS